MSTAEWIAAVVIGLGTAVINKLWNKSSDSKDSQKADLVDQCKTAIETARSVMTQIVLTAKPDATVEWLIQQCKGAIAIQMAKVRTAVADKPWALVILDSPAVQLLVDQAIAEAAETFVRVHPAAHGLIAHTLELPINKKIDFVLGIAESTAAAANRKNPFSELPPAP